MSISFSSDPIEQQEHVEGLLNEGLFECLLFSMGCDNYQIKTFENIENEIMKKELKKMKFETIPSQKIKKLNELKQPSFVSYNNNNQPLEQIHDNELLHLIKFEKKHILEDCWKLIIHYIPIQDFNSFLKVCKFFYSILTETIYFKNMKNLVYKFTTQNYDNVQDNFLQLVDNQLVREYFYHKQRDKHYLNILEDNNKLINIFENITDRNKRKLPKFLQNRELTNLEYNLLKFIISKGLISYLKCLPNHWFTKNNNELYLFCLQYPIRYAFDFIPNELQNDRNICLQFIVKNHPYLFQKISKELQEDKEIILTCLDNLIKLKQTITIPNEIRIKINRDPEILIKLFTLEKLLTNIVNDDLLKEYEGKPLYYKLIEINPNDFYQCFLKHYKVNSFAKNILEDKEIYKYFIKSNNCLEIINIMPKTLVLDFELAKELISLDKKVICNYLNHKNVYNKIYIEQLLNLLPDITHVESLISDSYNLRNHIDADIDLLIRKFGVSKYLANQRNLDYNLIIYIFSNYSTRLYSFITSHCIYYQFSKQIIIQKEYIESQRNLQRKLKTSEENKTIYIEPLSNLEIESLQSCNNINLALEIIKKAPFLIFYCDQLRNTPHILKTAYFSLQSIEAKVRLFGWCAREIKDHNLLLEFLGHCIFITPHLLNYETKEFFIDKFIPFINNYILNNDLTFGVQDMLLNLKLPYLWKEDKDFFLKQIINYYKNNHYNLNTKQRNLILESLVLPLLLKQQKVTDYIDAFKMIIEVNPTLINLFPKELQLNYNILQVIFDKDILNCVNYLPIEILDSFKFLMFDSVDSSKRKLLLQQFKERYNKELNLQ
ncbi:hypothetical protein ABK040_001199 [Willaertia magna]